MAKGFYGSGSAVAGLEEAIEAIGKLENKVSKGAMVAGIRAGLSTMASAVRRGVNATEAGTENEASLKSGMRRLVGSRFEKGGVDRLGKSHETIAKVGFGVGKKSDERMSLGETKGVGVTRRTLHWFVLGTTRMAAIFDEVVANAVASSGEAAMQKAVTKAKRRFEILAARAAKRK